jgi:hypothetical protein
MLRVIHSFDIKPGVDERSFIEWLDATLWEKSRPFGCIQRKTWVFLGGFEGTYESPKSVRRPRYLNEAFWESQEAHDRFLKWLTSEEAKEFRARWFSGITNHTVLRYVEYPSPTSPTDD